MKCVKRREEKRRPSCASRYPIHLVALAREHPVIKRLREKPVRKQVIKVPARRTALGLPCPPVPSVALGESVKLSLDVAAGISLLFISELRNRTPGLADTAVGDGSLGV